MIAIENQIKRLETVKEVAARTGLAPSTIYTLAHARKIPFVKLSVRAIRFDPVVIQAWIDVRRVEEIC